MLYLVSAVVHEGKILPPGLVPSHRSLQFVGDGGRQYLLRVGRIFATERPAHVGNPRPQIIVLHPHGIGDLAAVAEYVL